MPESEEPKNDLNEQKLKAEIKILERHWLKNPGYVAPVAGFFIAFIGLMFTTCNGFFDIKRDKLENQKTLLQIEINSFETQKSTLNKQVEVNKAAKDSLELENKKLLSENANLRNIKRVLEDGNLSVDQKRNDLVKRNSELNSEVIRLKQELQKVNPNKTPVSSAKSKLDPDNPGGGPDY